MAGQAKGKQAGSVEEGLKSVFQQLAALQLEPDAQQHMQFIQAIQQAIMKYLQQQQQVKAQQAAQMQQVQRQQAMMNPQMGGPQQGQSQGGPPQGQPGGPPSQGSKGLAMPNPDELQRMLATQGAG